MGFLAAVGCAALVGLAVDTTPGRLLFERAAGLLDGTPLLGAFHRSLRDPTRFISKSKRRGKWRVVSLRIGNPSVRLVGFVTREGFDDLPTGIGSRDDVAAYLLLGTRSAA